MTPCQQEVMYYEHIAFRVPVRREMFPSQVVTATKVLKSNVKPSTLVRPAGEPLLIHIFCCQQLPSLISDQVLL